MVVVTVVPGAKEHGGNFLTFLSKLWWFRNQQVSWTEIMENGPAGFSSALSCIGHTSFVNWAPFSVKGFRSTFKKNEESPGRQLFMNLQLALCASVCLTHCVTTQTEQRHVLPMDISTLTLYVRYILKHSSGMLQCFTMHHKLELGCHLCGRESWHGGTPQI